MRFSPQEDGFVAWGSLPDDAVAFVDRDWLDDSDDTTPELLLVSRDEATEAAVDARAAGTLAELARRALAALPPTPPRLVQVSGSGLAASIARRHLRSSEGRGAGVRRRLAKDQRPRAWLDFTGKPEVLRTACGELEDLGTLVLAGQQAGRELSLNLYPDVHARSLRIVGVSPRAAQDRTVDGPSPERITPGTPFGDARWYRFRR